ACAPKTSSKDKSSCTPGQSAACTCDSGNSGSQVCGDDGTFADCACKGDHPGGGGGGSVSIGGQGGGSIDPPVGGGGGTGGSSGSSGSGGTGGMTGCGSYTYNLATCAPCVQQNCCAQAGACANNPECLALLACFSQNNCGNDQSCVNNCGGQHPNGVTDN